MWLRNIFMKTLRDNRLGALIWGTLMAMVVGVGTTQYGQVMGQGADRERLIAEAGQALRAFSFLLGEITDLSTIGGFITARLMGFLPVVLALWAAVAGVGAMRGEEQNGTMEIMLATPHNRIAMFVSKALGVFASISLLVVVLWLGLVIGLASVGELNNVGWQSLLLTLLNLLAISLFWGAVGMLVSQFVGIRRTASSVTGGLLFATFLLNNLLVSVPSLDWLAWISPFHYYSVSKPLVPGETLQVGPWLFLVALTAGLTLLAGYLFARRDAGAVFRLFPKRAATVSKSGSNRMLTSPLGKAMLDVAWPTVLWGLGLGIYAAVSISTSKEVLEPIKEISQRLPWMAAIVGNIGSTESYLSFSLFTFLPVLLAVYAVMQVSAWAEDEEEGRMETLTSTPQARWRFLLPRYVAFALSVLGIILILGLLMWGAAAMTNTPLAFDRVTEGLLGAVPVALCVLALGLAAATWLKRPTTALPITAGAVALMFFLDLFAPIFNLPEVVNNLSLFYLYGKPVIEGIKWGSLSAVSLAAVVLGAASFVGFQRRDIAK